MRVSLTAAAAVGDARIACVGELRNHYTVLYCTDDDDDGRSLERSGTGEPTRATQNTIFATVTRLRSSISAFMYINTNTR